ncbi:hypothetical protein JAAARDRAFT_247145 [Jaapia argillacea MUCL 33604]|uniref:Uncharacterized protein n=1 Tax=Jaapia argillacea MUCL 33604 TaxID=933084 RepID=A0A067QDQ1_9AGAM|nr:hypothetical protein JAAARDRAFT_247145 [Jaapia argillacea MUCL 33604]
MIPWHIQARITSARRGSPESLMYLAGYLSEEQTPERALAVLPSFFHAIKANPPPGPRGPKPNQITLDVVNAVMRGLLSASGCLQQSEAVVRRYADGWQYVWPWVVFLAEEYLLGTDVQDQSNGLRSYSAIFCVLIVERYCSEPAIRVLAVSSPLILNCICRLWIRQAEDPSLSSLELEGIDGQEPILYPSCSRALNGLMKGDLSAVMAELRKHLDEAKLASTAVAHLDRQPPHPESLENIQSDLKLFDALVGIPQLRSVIFDEAKGLIGIAQTLVTAMSIPLS